jgi:hypothetical protein
MIMLGECPYDMNPGELGSHSYSGYETASEKDFPTNEKARSTE